MSQTTIDLLGQPFTVDWQSTDRRLIANRESQKCYELILFKGFEHGWDMLHRGLPTRIERCWLPNPNYQTNAARERFEWQRATGKGFDRRDGKRPEIAGYYYPPEARGLRLIDPKNPDVSKIARKNMHAAQDLQHISKHEFVAAVSGPAASLLSRSGMIIYLATFDAGDFLLLKDVAECAVPDEAKAQWRSAERLQATNKVLHKTKRSESELARTRDALEKAKQAAATNLKEALEKWMHFDPPQMRAITKAKVEKAVKRYLTDGEMRSLAKIAKEFHVSRKTVSTWFKSFSSYTSFPVVRHHRHESVANQLKEEQTGTIDQAEDDCPTE